GESTQIDRLWLVWAATIAMTRSRSVSSFKIRSGVKVAVFADLIDVKCFCCISIRRLKHRRSKVLIVVNRKGVRKDHGI
ncbi:hypothetical protein K0U83_22395, partial [bacterium]|nr:hypothetical protein [bacterium]